MLLRALFILSLLFGLTITSLGRSRSMTLKTGRATALSPAWVNATPQRTGVRNSAGAQRLTEKQLQLVQVSLRHKSGLLELGFDEQGVLTLGNRQHFEGGSATARA